MSKTQKRREDSDNTIREVIGRPGLGVSGKNEEEEEGNQKLEDEGTRGNAGGLNGQAEGRPPLYAGGDEDEQQGATLLRADGKPLLRYDGDVQTRRIMTREERLARRALRSGWNVRAELRDDCLGMCASIVNDKKALNADRISSMRAVAVVDQIDQNDEKMELERERLAMYGVDGPSARETSLHIHVEGAAAEEAVVKALQLKHQKRRLGPEDEV